jgi:hypothetical protein
MSVRLSRSGCTSALVLFCCAAGMVFRAAAQETKSAPPPASPAWTAASSQSNAKPDALKQQEDELRRSLQSLSPKSSPDTSLAPQYRPPVVVVPDKRARDAEERRKNWLLPEPDSLEPGTSTKEWLNSPENPLDTKAKTKKSLDDFYERLNQGNSHRLMPRASDTDPLGTSRSEKAGGEITSRDDANLPGGIRDSAKRLQDLLGGFDRAGDRSAPSESGGLSTFFGQRDKELSPEDLKAHKAYMDEYRKVLNGLTPPLSSALTPLAPPGSGNSPPGSGSPGGFNDLTESSRPKGFDSTPGMLTTLKDPGTLPDLNANALNQWNPLYSAPKLEPPKAAPLSVPQAEAPRRRF